MKGPKKLCFSCMREISLFANRCPYCTDDNQGVEGRIIFVIIMLICLILLAHWYV